MEGDSLANHRDAPTSYIPNADPGRFGGGTYTSQQVEPTLEAYENIFGPSARDIKQDLQRFKRHGRWHLPDILKGPNQYLTDRIDGLITDATSSPFTGTILPYKYITNVDGKIKWNVWSFDEGLASRVPYESAARTLTQSKRSYAGYTIRQGMAIVLEHNFMMTDAGRTNFKNQLNQLIGSIQLTNDLDVHVALVLAPSYQKTMQEKYLTNDKTPTQVCREFVDMFGFIQKNQNALDILIEEAKGLLKTWGAPMPSFMLCNSKLTFQLTMTPDVTNYVANGPEGAKRLRTGPDLQSYRGINIIHTRAFSMETGAPPRDILRRRVRVAEYYRILPHRDNYKRLFQLYNEERDTMSSFTFADLLQKALSNPTNGGGGHTGLPGIDNDTRIRNAIAGLSSHAGMERGPAPAPALGRAIDTPPEGVKAHLTELYTQIYDDKTRCQEFTWEPLFVHPNIVFVPGATDRSQGAAYDDLFAVVSFRALPAFIKQALEEKRASIIAAAGGAAATTDADKNLLSFKTQSVSQYPRNVLTFVEEIKGPAGAGAGPAHAGYIAYDFPASYRGAADAAIRNLPAAYTAHDVHLLERLATRNFMRYGISKNMLHRGVTPRTNVVTYATAFNLTAAPDTANPLDQVLRSKGAFYCPNHFQGEVMGSPAFSKLADYLGYNVLITAEDVGLLTKQRPRTANTDPYSGTALYDVILNPRKYDGLFRAVLALLNAAKAQIDAAAGTADAATRATITHDHSAPIMIAFRDHTSAPGREFTANSLTHDGSISYWLWPGADDVTDDVFASAQPWAHRVRRVQDFHNELDLTVAVVTELAGHGADGGGAPIARPLSDGPLTAPVDTTRLPVATLADVQNFFKMLAWRMWADQTIQLETVVPALGMWPDANQFLHPTLYTSPHFGGPVMSHGTESITPGRPGAHGVESIHSENTKDIEVVIIRPNIEHYMLGIILGQGGEALGSTFWGQTELSCYDDSQHGIWGMSYKYNARAIVINERNLVRLWDIAYDGYVGGKEDSAVNWNDNNEQHPNSAANLATQTMDVTRPYRGPSMMVMAFDHKQAKSTSNFSRAYSEEFKTNWPSPIVFYDQPGNHTVHLPTDFDNTHVVDADQFRVFNKSIYQNAYNAYLEKMPNFWELHKIRKNAGLAAVENEVSSDALAFQGTMRTLSAENGQVIAETMGSGHHGPDFVGVASLRAGKGYKINSQPTLQRTI